MVMVMDGPLVRVGGGELTYVFVAGGLESCIGYGVVFFDVCSSREGLGSDE